MLLMAGSTVFFARSDYGPFCPACTRIGFTVAGSTCHLLLGRDIQEQENTFIWTQWQRWTGKCLFGFGGFVFS